MTPAERPVTGDERRGSLVVVGTGISLARQVTVEALECIRRADKLLYLSPNPAVGIWLKGLNPTAETLEDSYAEGKPRDRTYKEIANRILAAVRSGLHVCVAFYGHPGVFADSTHDAIRRARLEGFPARMLPGVSAEDCLFADIGEVAGLEGWQSFEATDFLLARRRFDPSSALILWQVGLLGEASVKRGMTCRPERLRFLAKVLRRHYPARHPIVLYEAAQFPICDPIVQRTSLSRLTEASIPPAATVYIPPKPSRVVDWRVARWLSE